jgi:hypothetical protein
VERAGDDAADDLGLRRLGLQEDEIEAEFGLGVIDDVI